jgi:diacylglycerol kinase family enzyme
VNVWLLVNKDAGRGMSAGTLCDLIEGAGHVVLDAVEANGETLAPDRHADLVAVAGGDGTVAAASSLVAGSATPLAILPLGTANNIARSLALSESIPELIAGWASARRVPFDLGYARAATREWRLVEGAGAGLIPAGIAARQRAQHRGAGFGHPATEVADAVRTFSDVLEGLEPRRWSIVIDGTRRVEDYLLVEVLNIPSVGPNLTLSAGANPTDGYFDVVLAERKHRDELMAYLSGCAQGRGAPLSLPGCRARSITIEGCDDLHIDDERIDTCQLGEISISIAPGAMTVLV